LCEEAAAEGEVDLDEDFGDSGDSPPLHPNAVFAGYAFAPYGALRQMVSSRYDGPAVTIDTVGHGRITIGPNHPVLTRRGFVAARCINKGDQLLYDAAVEAPTVIGESHFKQMPMIEDAFASLQSVSDHTAVAAASRYFHGDEVFTYGEVKIVRPTRPLLPILDPGAIEHLGKCPLSGADADALHVAGCGACHDAFERVFVAASGSECGFGDSTTLLGGHLRIARFHRLTVVASHLDHFSGFAFDASTACGQYNIGGVVVKNCMCEIELFEPDEEDDE
jgi:hypothetical protein